VNGHDGMTAQAHRHVAAGPWGLLVTRFGLHSVVLLLVLLPHVSPVVALPTVEPFRLYPLVPALYLSMAGFAYWNWRGSLERANAAVQLASDGVFLGWLTGLTGGFGSPFIVLYLILIYAATWLLPPHGGAVSLAGCVASYIGVGWFATGDEVWSGNLSFLNQEIVLSTLFAFVATAGLAHLLMLRQEVERRQMAKQVARFTSLQAFHTSIIQSIHSGLITLDKALRITSVNQSGADILGQPAVTVLDQDVCEIFALTPQLRGRLEDGESGMRLECKFASLSENRRVAGLSISPLMDDQGEDAGYVISFQDVTALKRLEAQVNAREQLAVIGELSARLAHEIRNPLAAISGSVQVISAEFDATGPEAQLLNVVVRESDRLNQLLKDFLSYARPRPLCAGLVNVTMLVQEVVELFRNDPDAVGVELQIISSREDCCGEIDGEALTQCVTNLVRNALQCSPVDGGRVVVEIDTPKDGDGEDLYVSVADNGPGIPPEEIDRIFFPFHSSKEGGTGLGLSVVKSLTEAMGGALNVSSEVGQGSVFALTIPTVRRHPVAERDAVASIGGTRPV
jgi:two-component system sensor histidine kinase PilS (NtrC family)